MKQEAALQEASHQIQGKEQRHDISRLGPLLCWAVVFADVGTSIYYVPGILYGNVGNLAGFFVMLTMSVLVTVFTHLSFSQFLALFPHMFAHQKLTLPALLAGFAGSFLAFSGLESISQLSPVMKTPRKKVAGIALFLVVFTIGLTSPLLTMFATLLLPPRVVGDSVLSTQVISLLGGHWDNIALQIEVAISASALLIFAANTAIIGSYHVFLALSRMEFFPKFIQQRNKLRGTPHFSILLAIAIPICVLIVVNGTITTLGDMYAFGLLGAFTLTCVGLDIVRRRERKAARAERVSSQSTAKGLHDGDDSVTANKALKGTTTPTQAPASFYEELGTRRLPADVLAPSPYTRRMVLDLWHTCKFYLGLLTTALVGLAWTTNLVAKPMATIFGGSVTFLGMGIACFTYSRKKQQGHVPVPITHIEEHLPGSILAVLLADNTHNEAVIHAAIDNAHGQPVTFLYLGQAKTHRAPHLFEFHDPYYDDQQARKTFGKAEHLAQKAKIARRFVYRQQEPEAIEHIWQVVHPRDLVIWPENTSLLEQINPDRIRYEVTPDGSIAHLLKSW